jgi:hypothetical protein
VEGIKESLAEDSLQKGKIISFPFLNGYTDVRCMVGALDHFLNMHVNCGIGNSQNLEQLQLEAARIVTGLPIFTKAEILYRETKYLDTLLLILSTWLFHLASLLNVTPKCL